MTESSDSRHGYVLLEYRELEDSRLVQAEFVWNGSEPAENPPVYTLDVGSFVRFRLDRDVPVRLLGVSVEVDELLTVESGFLQQFIGQRLIDAMHTTLDERQLIMPAELTLENRLAIAGRQADDRQTPASLQRACRHLLQAYLNPDKPQP